MRKYGSLPKVLGEFKVEGNEQFSYQYLPIKLECETEITIEDRLRIFDEIIGVSCCYFIGEQGLDKFVDWYVYLTAKRMYQPNGCPFNRPGWHADNFMDPSINVVWSDCQPTVFNTSSFNISDDDFLSMKEMEEQADPKNDVTYPDNTLLYLDQYVIHRVGDPIVGVRTFAKITISPFQFNLCGNSHNFLLDYNWEMKPRGTERNIPYREVK